MPSYFPVLSYEIDPYDMGNGICWGPSANFIAKVDLALAPPGYQQQLLAVSDK